MSSRCHWSKRWAVAAVSGRCAGLNRRFFEPALWVQAPPGLRILPPAWFTRLEPLARGIYARVGEVKDYFDLQRPTIRRITPARVGLILSFYPRAGEVKDYSDPWRPATLSQGGSENQRHFEPGLIP